MDARIISTTEAYQKFGNDYALPVGVHSTAVAFGNFTGTKDSFGVDVLDLAIGTSSNQVFIFQGKLGGGLMWLDTYCNDQYGKIYLECTPEQRTATRDLIAYRKNALQNPRLSQGIAFFAFLRNMTCDGFYTSKIGIADLQYIGNTSLKEFPGCPEPRQV